MRAHGPLRPAARTLAGVVAEKAASAAGHPAIRFEGQVITYGEMHAQAVAVARSLLACGAGPGSRIGVLYGNEPRWLVAALAASTLGATCIPLNTWYKSAELAWTLRHCEIQILLTATRFLKTDYRQVLDELLRPAADPRTGLLPSPAFPALRHIVFDAEPIPGTLDWAAFMRLGREIEEARLHTLRKAVPPEHCAFVLYTSGSTAEPKGVMLTHRGVVENGYDLGQRRAIDPEDGVWIGTPLFYALGATNALPAALTAGATIVLQGHFEAGEALRVIERTRATVYYGTGNMSRALLDYPEYQPRRVGSLKKGNAGTMAEYKRLTLVELGITGAVPAYGLTETYGNATTGVPEDDLATKIATNGRPLPGMEVIIVDPDSGRPLGTGETGLILVRGHTTPGYLNNPTETSKALRSDGFFDTGDLGSFDGEGRLLFHSRLKEVIKTGGINVSPIEVEQLLAAHPDVREAFVVGVPHPVRGELIVAYVDRVNPVSAQALQAFVRERAASFKVPHHILFRTERQLPRLATGKVAKHLLAQDARRELEIAP